MSAWTKFIRSIDTVTGITESNGSVRCRAQLLAQELKRKQIQPNDIILICSRSHTDQTIAVLACFLVGAIVAPLDPDLSRVECTALIAKLKPKVCCCDLRALKQVDQILQQNNMSSVFINFGTEAGQGILSMTQLLKFSNQMALSSNFNVINIQNPRKTVAFILHTQGTTGQPKLVCVSHHFIYQQTLILLKILGNPTKVMSFFPLSLFVQAVLTCMCFEASIVRVIMGTFSERQACKVIYDLKVDCAFLGSHLGHKLMTNVAVKDYNMDCLKTIAIGLRPTSRAVIEQYRRSLPKVCFIPIYYTTETGCAISYTASNYDQSTDRVDSVGAMCQNYRAKLVEMETRYLLRAHQVGELLIAGDIMLGYLKDMDSTIKSMDRDCYKTGDLARFDEDGWFYILERIEDLINYEGQVISAIEIEEHIMSHPYVKMAVVIGSEKNLVACVQIKPETKLDADKLEIFLTDKLSELKRPSKYYFMQDFPKTSIGTIKKYVLRNELLTVRIEHSSSAIF